MYEHKTLQNLDEYFIDLNARSSRGVYFYRVNNYNNTVEQFIRRYYEAARISGVVQEGKIPNPDENNLSYYEEIMGLDFRMDKNFLTGSLKKWLPRMDDMQRNHMADSICHTLEGMRAEGKNDNILKNAYIKFMCWLYYKFERILNRLGSDKLPKILYEGDVSNYELKLLTILSNAGCDVVLIQYHGDEGYLKLDPGSTLSAAYQTESGKPFPEEFCIKWLRSQIEEEVRIKRLYGVMPKVMNCTNAWIEGKDVFQDILKSPQARGTDSALFYNCFCRVSGVEDKLTYVNELYQFQLQLKNNKRRAAIVENDLTQPSMDEIASIKRNNYSNTEQMLLDLSNNIEYTANVELKRLMVKNFIDVVMEESRQEGMNLHKLTNMAVYLLCWIKRYQADLFCNWKMPDISCFIYMGGCKNRTQAMFIKFLSGLPVDVLLLKPDLNTECVLKDSFLYEKSFENSLPVDKFPREDADIHMGTAAYHAERELDTLMYQDSGLFRERQYEKAVSVSLITMYEEIAILWDQELKYRPNFSIVDNIVNIPVIFARVSGVKDGLVPQYWKEIKKLITEDTLVIKKIPFISSTQENPIKAHAVEFYKNGKVQRAKIKNHPAYQYGFLREEIQDYILDKLQLLIEQKTIKGTMENGTEYTIVSTVLNLNKDIIRLIQKFDFTKKNPKIIYINTTESIMPLEDSIMTAFLNLIGFDIVFFIPTGYQNIEKYFNKKIMEEHQLGDYMYDLHVPVLDTISSKTRRSWREKIFKRGN